jgi:hypothetical protein
MPPITERRPRALMLVGVISILAPTAISQTWNQLTPSGGPPSPRAVDVMAFDPATDRAIIFGGVTSSGLSNDSWVLADANGLAGTPTWIQLSPIGGAPQARTTRTAYDSINNRLIIMDGCLGSCLPVANDLWILTNANGLGGTPAWIQLSPIGGPPAARVDQVMAYDPGTNSLIVWGGQIGCCASPQTYSDAWVLTNANGLGGTPAWTQLSTVGGPPPGQDNATGIYDSVTNRLVVFGGIPNQGFHATNAVWVLSNANGHGGTPTWTNLVAEGAPNSPPVRASATAVYDVNSNRMFVFGGASDTTSYNDTWVLVNANGLGGIPAWTHLTPNGGLPMARSRAAGGFDVSSDRMILFGGESASGNFLNDTWVSPELTSKVSPLPPTETTNIFPVQWSGSIGSGIQDFTIYVSDNGGPFTAWLTNTTATQATYLGVGGHTYGFYSIARDVVGNVEGGKTMPEASTIVLVTPVVVRQITGTLGNNGWYMSNVTVSWSVSDLISGIGSSTGCTTTILTAETAGTTLTCSATNGVGLSNSVPVTIKIDTVAPEITCAANPNMLSPPNGNPVAVTVSGTLADATAGVDPNSLIFAVSDDTRQSRFTGAFSLGTAGNYSFSIPLIAAQGVYTITVIGKDNAGNPGFCSTIVTVP